MCLDCLLQIVNVIFWIVPHAVILTVDCSWFDVIINVSGVIRWTIWNTVGPTHLRNVLPGKQANLQCSVRYIFGVYACCVSACLVTRYSICYLWDFRLASCAQFGETPQKSI